MVIGKKFDAQDRASYVPYLLGSLFSSRHRDCRSQKTTQLEFMHGTRRVSRIGPFLQFKELIAIMQTLIIDAHPDPKHYLQQPDHIKCINCHSTHVTACVALAEGNALVERIAHKLQWSMESIKHYIQDCSHMMGATTAKVIQGFHHV